MAIDVTTLALAKAYAKGLLESWSGSTGKNVTIESIVAIDGGNRITFGFTDDNGVAQEKALDVMDGKDGADGKNGTNGTNGKDGTSPVISVSTITGGHRITITDANGTKTVDVMDGSDGKNGNDGASGDDGVTPQFSIGTVETLEAGSAATASIVGTAEKPVLNLGIPKGKDGSSDSGGSAADAVSQHNVATDSHADLRLELQNLADRINAALDSDDTTLDELSEIVAYIKSNKTLIDAITTSKVSVTDIIDNLVTNVANKPLSAAQGVVLKGMIEGIRGLIPPVYTLPVGGNELGGVKNGGNVVINADGTMTAPEVSSGNGIAVTGATVGQTVKIAAVDEEGVPTAWEPVDMPSGGVEEWELIESNSLVDVLTVEKNFDVPYKHVVVFMRGVVHAATGGMWTINVNNYQFSLGGISAETHGWGHNWQYNIVANGKFVTVDRTDKVLGDNTYLGGTVIRDSHFIEGESISCIKLNFDNADNPPTSGKCQIWGCK